MDRVFVYLVNLPDTISEVVMPCADGYTIYIDKNLTFERQQEVYMHALGHICRNDFDCGLPADTIELYAHKADEKERKKGKNL